ncbi:hypothetical protein CB1_092430001 [Camelus ferus]|nr:hypothetical protein CB1_092430001 [Camelus ferus]
MDLGRVDSFSASKFAIAYTPVTNTTQQIMKIVASASFMKAHCYETNEEIDCGVLKFWKKGFVALQAAINAAIIEITTNHSVMEELMSVTGKNMKIYPFISQGGVLTDFFIFFCIISFSPFTYYASINVTRERKKMAGLMRMMGLRNSAFWLSWGLLYAAFVFIVALFLTLIVKSAQFVILTGFLKVFTLFLLYGLSLLLHLDYDLNSNAFLNPSDSSNLIIATNFMLVFDIFFYLALAIYFEKILPNEYGHRYSPLFFLKSSFWSRQRRADHVALEDEIDSNPSSNDAFEPMSPEFHGKEAIRIRNVTKEYKGKPDKIEALKGSVTIYNNKLSEMVDLENISKLTGVCPQSNVQFDFLTVRENLWLFAKIKGIQPHKIDKEIQRVLLELEMKNIQDVLAQNLSGGQKRKLTFGIAILGDPQIFLLDEPTAGLDPFSRHQVWNLLKEWKAGRVILFSTQFMDEADILAGDCWLPLKIMMRAL